jgi:hypothetical protein
LFACAALNSGTCSSSFSTFMPVRLSSTGDQLGFLLRLLRLDAQVISSSRRMSPFSNTGQTNTPSPMTVNQSRSFAITCDAGASCDWNFWPRPDAPVAVRVAAPPRGSVSVTSRPSAVPHRDVAEAVN